MSPVRDPVVIAGAGGAGLIAAWRAAALGARVLLCERNRKPGIKLLISGGGKCNVTHSGTMEEVRSAFLLRQARFLKQAFHCFKNTDMIHLLEWAGVKTYTRENGRVFPVSGRAADVVDAIVARVRDANAELRLGVRVEHVISENNKIVGVVCNGERVTTSHLIIATGGVSYPRTGTAGDGFRWLEDIGHTIVPLRPALAPMSVDPLLPAEWRGIAVRDGCLSVFAKGRKVCAWTGDILFTHEGISGPATLEVSRLAAGYWESGEAELKFDFLPDAGFAALDARLQQNVSAQRSRMISTVLEPWVPKRMIPHLLESIGVPVEQRGHTLSREQRRAVVRLLKEWHIGRVSHIDIERGEVTAGGVSLDEVDPRTMRSRKVHGLYLCGEILDIAGPVGGYNLQAAFSTGYVAGEAAAQDWLELPDRRGNSPEQSGV